jgi:hypothetical protein
MTDGGSGHAAATIPLRSAIEGGYFVGGRGRVEWGAPCLVCALGQRKPKKIKLLALLVFS